MTNLKIQAALDLAEEQTIARLQRELQSSLCDLVCSGDLTAEQANEQFNAKCDQWALGLS